MLKELSKNTTSDGFVVPYVGQAKDLGLGEMPENYEKDVWVPDGTWRAFGGVYVALQDEAGLVPINTVSEARLRNLFVLAGASPSASRTLAAEFGDYTDYDTKIRTGGAERVQYRNAGLHEPPNEDIRDWAEIKQLKSWSKYAGEIDFELLQKVTTLNSGQFGISEKYAPLAISSFWESDEGNLIEDVYDPLAFDVTSELHPTDRVRVTFIAIGEHPFIRQMSVLRSPRDIEKPFHTTRVFNRSLSGEEVTEIRDEFLRLGLLND